ncbi:MAG TPA: hypothetical protein P5150_06420 [Candidatus Ratteibacteria bacterium]|nr:hypothetical protein [bacterium]HRR96347.1 hypothetical protein [Candidatus Ratteibacteria bacterium]
MGKNKKRIFIITVLAFFCILILPGCNRKQVENKKIDESQLKKFSFKQFSENFNLTIIGEGAEINEKDIKVNSPSFYIKGETDIIEIKTGKEGTAEITIQPENKQIQNVVFTGNIKITQKDKVSGKIIMEAECGKLTYNDMAKEMIMEISPVIKRENNIFSGEKIYYFLEKNTLQIKGNVNVKIIPEK